MIDKQHPITPPPELVQQWCHEDGDEIKTSPRWYQTVCAKAARWGADQELEACCEWLRRSLPGYDKHYADYLREARRPKPPSLKEQALEAMSRCDSEMWCEEMEYDLAIIRTALEFLPS